MKVIIAGMPKTGTKSMAAALKVLGYNVYDSPENTFLLADEYGKIVFEGWTTDDFRKMYENIDAVCDLPAYFFWDEIHKAFPDAKIVLTMRNSEEEWFQSFEKQLQQTDRAPLFRMMQFLSPTFMKSSRFLRVIVLMCLGIPPQRTLRQKTVLNAEMSKKLYRQHNAYVQHSAPKGKLLVYTCSEGWGPLCAFLEVPVPDRPFPHKNKGGSVAETATDDFPIFRKIQREVIVSSVVLTSVTIFAGFSAYKYGLSRILSNAAAYAHRTMLKFGMES